MHGGIFMEDPFLGFGRVGDDKIAAVILTHPFALHFPFLALSSLLFLGAFYLDWRADLLEYYDFANLLLWFHTRKRVCLIE